HRAGTALVQRYRGLRFLGAIVPPLGFAERPADLAKILDEVVALAPDLVLIGLGFPKQERLAALLAARLPESWFLGCGGAVAMAAGELRRSPAWAQRSGLEWVIRLVQEPRRLARRYLIDDAPAAIALLAGSVRARLGKKPPR
ncbi:MAG: WecB/TagA/CpsF family glycosyltransferase, partial [Angustibacter sp.]